jgi:hypothetical protein
MPAIACDYNACSTLGKNMSFNPGGSTAPYYGDVIGQPRVYIVYWGWGGPNGPDPNANRAAYHALLDGTSSSLGGTRWMNVVSQYTGYDNWSPFDTETAAGSVVSMLNGEIWDDSPWRPVAYDVASAQAEAVWAKSTLNIPSADGDAIMLLAYPPGFNNGGASPDHSYGLDAAGIPVPFIQMPYSGFQNIEQSTSHEIVETITDPDQTAWWVPLSSSCPNIQCEIGDLCNQSTTQNWTVHLQPNVDSVIQTFWSNAANKGAGACVHARSTNANAFVIANNQLYQQYNQVTESISQYGYTSWGAPAGQTLWFKPATVSWGPRRIDNFARAGNGNVYHAWSDNGGQTSSWENVGAPPAPYVFTGSPDAASWGFGRLDVFHAAYPSGGGNRQIFHKAYDMKGAAGWSGWTAIPQPPTTAVELSGPTAASWGTWLPGSRPRIDVFAYFSDNALWRATTFDGNNFAWAKIGALPACAVGDPDVAAGFDAKTTLAGYPSSDYERWDVFVRDCNGNLWDGPIIENPGQAPQLQGWALWSPPSGLKFTAGPAVTGLGDGRLLVAGTASDNNVYVAMWDYGWFIPWTHVAGPVGGAPDLSSW